MANLSRRFRICLVLVLASAGLMCGVSVRAETYSFSGGTASISLVRQGATDVFDYTFNGGGDGHHTVAELYAAPGQGGAFLGRFVNLVNGTGPLTGTITVASGQWCYVADHLPTSPFTRLGFHYQEILFSPSTFKVTVSLFNSRDVAVTYKVMQGATEIGSVTLQPGTGLIQTFTTPSADPVTVLELVPDLAKDGDAWVVVDGATHTSTVGTATPASVPSGGSNPPAVPISQAPDVPTNTSPNVAPAAKPVWKNVTVNSDPANQTDLLTNSVYREGVDKIVQPAKDYFDKHQAALDANPASGAAASAGVSAGSAVAALFPSAPAASITASASAPTLTVAMPAKFGGATFDFNPFASDRFASICTWFRTATAWLCLVTLGVWIWSHLGEWVRGFSTIRQATGNPVVGGTGAQATALVAAGLMTVAVVTALAALLSWSFGDITIISIRSMAGTNPLAAMPAAVLWMLDQLFPVVTMVTCFIARLTFNMYAAPLFATCSAVVRFIVP